MLHTEVLAQANWAGRRTLARESSQVHSLACGSIPPCVHSAGLVASAALCVHAPWVMIAYLHNSSPSHCPMIAGLAAWWHHVIQV
jgi:hypothetical protein